MNTKHLHEAYPGLYGSYYDIKKMDERFLDLERTHERLFGSGNPMIFSSGGRMEVCGNHTDHNQGLVIGATINLDTIGAVTERSDRYVTLSSKGFRPVDIDLEDLSIKEEEKGSSSSLVRGIAAWIYENKGIKVGGFNANTTTRVLRGSGLSSSAAIEVLVGEIYNELYCDGRLTPLEIAIAGKFAENNYFGKPSGLLDQVACAYGGVVKIDFKDPSSPKVDRLSVKGLLDAGLAIIVTDTKGNHADLTGEYAAVPKEMKEVASYFGKENLREVSYREFLKALPKLREITKNDRALLRAFHFYRENKRVTAISSALKKNDIDAFLCLIRESGRSSFEYLQNVYPGFAPHEQGMAIGLMIAESILESRGAFRVHGGGFAGTILAFVPEGIKETYKRTMEKTFGKGSNTEIAIRKKSVTRIL